MQGLQGTHEALAFMAVGLASLQVHGVGSEEEQAGSSLAGTDLSSEGYKSNLGSSSSIEGSSPGHWILIASTKYPHSRASISACCLFLTVKTKSTLRIRQACCLDNPGFIGHLPPWQHHNEELVVCVPSPLPSGKMRPGYVDR